MERALRLVAEQEAAAAPGGDGAAAAGPSVSVGEILEADAEGARAVKLFWGRRKQGGETWEGFFQEREAQLDARRRRYLEDMLAGKYDDPAFLDRQARDFDLFDQDWERRRVNAGAEFPVPLAEALRPKAEQLPWAIEEPARAFDSDLEDPWPEELEDARFESDSEDELFRYKNLGPKHMLFYYNRRYRQMKRAQVEHTMAGGFKRQKQERDREERLGRDVRLALGEDRAALSPATPAGTHDALGRERLFIPEEDQFNFDSASDLEFTFEEQRERAQYAEDVKAFGYGGMDNEGKDERDSVSRDFGGGIGPVTLLKAAKDEYDWRREGHWWEQEPSDNDEAYAYQVEERGVLDDTNFEDHLPGMVVQDRYYNSDEDEEDPGKTPLAELISDTFGPKPNDPVVEQDTYQPTPEWNSTIDPQVSLWGTSDPYAPFPIATMMWESFVYDDGTTYEGLAREELPHGYGTLLLGTTTAGNLKGDNVGEGVKYEGMFRAGYVHGLGQMSWPDGKLFRGEWNAGRKHGCGAMYDYGPFYELLREGLPADEAWARAGEAVQAGGQMGTWWKDEFVSDPREDLEGPSGAQGRVHTDILHPDDICDRAVIAGTLQELDSVVMRARMFQHKPDGEAMLHRTDAQGTPVPTMQDPLYYPPGTKWLAPGPLGQLFSLPDSPQLRENMQAIARNYKRIYRMYNFPFEGEEDPEGDLVKAAAYWPEEAFTDGPNSAFWYRHVVAPLEKSITDDVQFHTDRDSIDIATKGYINTREFHWGDRARELVEEVWSGLGWLPKNKERRTRKAGGAAGQGPRGVGGSSGGERDSDAEAAEALANAQDFVQELEEKFMHPASEFTKSMYRNESVRQAQILKTQKDRRYRRNKRAELLNRIDRLQEDFYKLEPRERYQRNSEIVVDVIDFGFLEDLRRAGQVTVEGLEGGGEGGNAAAEPTASLAGLRGMDWEAPQAAALDRKYFRNPLLDPVLERDLTEPERQTHRKVLDYLYRRLPQDDESMKLLYTNRQLEELGLEPARQMQEVERRYGAVYERWEARDRERWEELERKHGSDNPLAVAEEFWDKEALQHLEMRGNLRYTPDKAANPRAERWAALKEARARLDESLAPLVENEWEEFQEGVAPEKLRELIRNTPELRESVEEYRALYREVSEAAEQEQVGRGGALQRVLRGTWLRKVGVPWLPPAAPSQEDWEREETVRDRLQALQQHQYRELVRKAREVRRRGGDAEMWENLAKSIVRTKDINDIRRDMDNPYFGETDDDDTEVSLYKTPEDELITEQQWDVERMQMLTNVKNVAKKARGLRFVRLFGRHKNNAPELGEALVPRDPGAEEPGEAPGGGSSAAPDFSGARSGDWRRRGNVLSNAATAPPPTACLAAGLVASSRWTFPVTDSLSRRAKRAQRR